MCKRGFEAEAFEAQVGRVGSVLKPRTPSSALVAEQRPASVPEASSDRLGGGPGLERF